MSVKKIIVVGDVCGNFEFMFSRINMINNKQGPFDIVFCVGNFFGTNGSKNLEPYLKNDNDHVISVPTYFITSDDEDTKWIDKMEDSKGKEESVEVCKNLYYLGRYGVQTIKGLNVAYLSGVYDSLHFSTKPEQDETNRVYRKYYSTYDIKHLSCDRVDVLLTSEWGRGFYHAIAHGLDKSSSLLPYSIHDFVGIGSPVVSKLACRCAPQYHFAGDAHHRNTFLQLMPYRNERANSTTTAAITTATAAITTATAAITTATATVTTIAPTTLTRFIALAPVGKEQKSKYLYACNITLASTANDEKSKDVGLVASTPCPYNLPYVNLNANDPNKRRKSSDGRTSITSSAGADDMDSKSTSGQDHDEPELKRVIHKRKFEQMVENESGKSSMVNVRWTTHRPNGPPPANYVCYKCGVPGHYIQECSKYKPSEGKSVDTALPGGNRDDYFFERFGGRRAMKRAKKSGGECWFCLGSNKLEGHMIVSVGENTYLALAKGPLVEDHILIVPIHHLPNSMKFTPGVRREIEKYLLCLEKCYEKEQKRLLICDRNLQTKYASQHGYLEIVAVEKNKLDNLEDILTKEAVKESIEFQKITKDANLASYVGAFGHLVLHERGGERYVHSVQSALKHIPLNFLRRVIAIQIGCPEKAEWTACIQDVADESNLTSKLKEKFKPYDWTLRNK
ncbi:hypothetical protein RFI_05570 [Reticulomyxa filosa]|uniref:CCHC-type domain-containing protein n=1 Tax=Reticulomyxa filosa TaxID=46433 RepID=X6NZX9_RETFI|nr:hypothetical protein RFI_05570 [Reticulomyxa filosa]|eukprot:ETO31551.1 hypothetical protein RFI_05570 [Reticulomyxa filosa]